MDTVDLEARQVNSLEEQLSKGLFQNGNRMPLRRNRRPLQDELSSAAFAHRKAHRSWWTQTVDGNEAEDGEGWKERAPGTETEGRREAREHRRRT